MKRNILILLTLFIISCDQKTARPICDIPRTINAYGDAENYGYQPYYDIDIARECSQKTGRPILILFSGYKYLSCRGVVWEILTNKEIKKIIDDNYILTVLYVDDNKPLNTIDSSKKTMNGKIIKTVGQKNITFQIKNFETNGQPYYVFVDYNLNKIAEPIGYIREIDKEKFIEQLNKGLLK